MTPMVVTNLEDFATVIVQSGTVTAGESVVITYEK
jgi:hypothetical protein